MATYINGNNNAKINSNLTQEQAIEILTPFRDNSNFIRSLVFDASKNLLRGNQLYWFYKLAEEKNPVRERISVGAGFSRIQQMFASAKDKGLKKPKIKLKNGENKINLSLAPETGNNPNCIYVKVNGEYMGKVTPEGEFKPIAGVLEGVVDYLKSFAENPAKVAADYGHEVGACCFCSLRLDDPRSIRVGYGPICALKFNLPHEANG